MARRKRSYDLEFRIRALKELERVRSGPKVAAAFKLGKTTLYDWYRKALRGKIEGFTPSGVFQIPAGDKYPRQFKLEAVREVEEGGTLRGVAKRLNVDLSSLVRWMEEFGEGVPLVQQFGEAEAEKGLASLREAEAARERAEKERIQAERKRIQAERDRVEGVRTMIADPMVWLHRYTETRDSHWRENGAESPYHRLPDHRYLCLLMEGLKREPRIFILKSRNMLLSWLCVGFFTHAATTTPGIDVLFQSQKKEKSFELVEYAKTLYERQAPEVKEVFPVMKKLENMAAGELMFTNGSRIMGISGEANEIRSYHPWGLLMDEAAFMPEAGESYNNALPVCKKIVVVSSAGPGWFGDAISRE